MWDIHVWSEIYFMASLQTVISDCIFDNIALQMNFSYMVILLQMHFCYYLPLKSLFHLNSECCKPQKTACHPTKCDVINDVKVFLRVYHRYTVANLLCYPNSCCITSALEYSGDLTVFDKFGHSIFFMH